MRNTSDERFAMMCKFNVDDGYDTLYTYSPDVGVYNAAWSPRWDAMGNIVILNEINDYSSGPRSDVYEFMSLSSDGQIVSRNISPNHERRFSFSPNLVLDNSGNYIFPYHKANTTDARTYTIMSMTPDEEVNWVHIYPPYNSEGFGWVKLTEFKLAENGDILVCGYRERDQSIGDGVDIHVSRYTDTGEQLWSRYYNIPQNWVEMEYYDHFGADLAELADGSIVIVGLAHHHNDIVLLRIDADGCVDGFDCYENVILSDGQIQDLGYELSVFPNPSTDLLQIRSEQILRGSLEVFDNFGRVVFMDKNLNSKILNLDLSLYAKGHYHLRFHLDGRTYSYTIVKS